MESKPPPSPSTLRRLIDIDTAVSLHLYSAAQPILPRPLLKALEISGDGRLFFPLAISIFLSPLSNTTTSPLVFSLFADLLIGAVLDLLLVGLIKHLVRRPRPVYNKDMFHVTFAVDHWSFPSGHSSRVCFVAAFLCLSSAAISEIVAQWRSSGVEFVVKLLDFFDSDVGKAVHFLFLGFSFWAAATSFSRVLLGRHFVCDVIAGACLGVLEALIVCQFLNYSILASIILS
ncbi:Lipid phosphate phosphatase beta [Actinidia chinensis var. chinensis]|uniref:Lipid phosphate phosphatase beta n=1 Tax=Actinidia chinensis var. chinensis TaxID=1590841 RepID=A0A2R6QNL5_ACTCC|nr:Lipid phosphate phosphatase beta [Actinidia chinensis var. chinensis]